MVSLGTRFVWNICHKMAGQDRNLDLAVRRAMWNLTWFE